jgi:DNA recombination-dependent growth factor C
MAFFSATVTFTRYRADAGPVENFWGRAVEQVEALKFREGVSGIEDDSYGWCSVHDPYSDGITTDDISWGDFFLAAIRIEQRKVPAAVLRKYCITEEKRLKEEKDMRRLPARLRKEIRERVRFELMAKAIPVPRIVELLWDISSGQVFLFSCQERSREVAEELFYRTFGLRLQPVIPYTLAEEFAMAEGLGERLSSIGAEVLV